MEASGTPKSRISAIVAEDYEPFRRFLCSTLAKDSVLQIIAEVQDGLEAVRRAEELRPELILLDVGLPTLNGIEAARRIRKLAPESKILFVSQESSADVVQEAFAAGARGYVLKTDAGSELLIAVNAVLRGERFVSRRLAGHDFTGTSDSQTPNVHSRKELLASPAPTLPRTAQSPHRHAVQFYSDDAFFLDGLTQFLGNALKAGSAVIVVATESHRERLLPRLQVHGLDIGAAIEQGRYISLDATDALSRFMVNGMPDPVRFLSLFGNLIVTAAKAAKGEQTRVAVFGEGALLLWAQGNAEAAIQVETLTNQLTGTDNVDILCGYSLGSVQGGMNSHIFQRICAEHSAVHSQ
jgi:DNA-binding NarL/FixJ family response regulator